MRPRLLRGGAFLEEPGLVCEYYRLDTVAEAELGEDVRDVCLDGRLADVERRRAKTGSTRIAIAGTQNQSVVCGAPGEPWPSTTSRMAALARTATSTSNQCWRARSWTWLTG
jgi:hypothetical protein